MRTRLKLDRVGRVVLPKPIRDELGLNAGDALNLTVDGDTLTLRPDRPQRQLVKKRGVWVLRTGMPMSGGEPGKVLQKVRGARARRHLGLHS
ncbi:MAG: AbrB/MazE/SpoVT family DNA-binding domain-containing protein [Terriglobales bacterium]